MRRMSIRFRLAVWVSLLLLAASVLTFLTVRAAGALVLRGTLRDYLIGTVESNAERIVYADELRTARGILSIPCGDGFLEVDEDFLDEVSDVRAGLYTADGALLYGEDPLAGRVRPDFTGTRLYELEAAGERYILYDRALQPGPETVWLRGVASEARSAAQLSQITRLSLVLLPLLAAAAALASWLLAGRMLKPLRRIEQTAARISRGDDLGQRIDAGKREDEVGRLAEAFNRMLDRLERAFEAERRFTSDASHELRTPASVILAQCEYSLAKPRSAAEYEEALQVTRRQGRRMKALIGDMLDYTRMDQGTERYPFETVDLSQLTAETAALTEDAAARGITLETDLEPRLTVQGSPLLLSRLMQNLVSNACRYGRDGGHVRVTLARADGGIALHVADDGIGIAPEERERIFERFYRSDAARSVQGTGLGLSMVKRIAELHGAAVSVDSEPGAGSDFCVFFPENGGVS